ncbi:hypothetical protein [Sphingobium sp. BS19]|uniref:hypothetical protein n=1 Tax=Sphingobium sp. BS19 TaxID=3018973 RepID=UPI0022EEAC82|nr:hypothetical protein [Sphingobium sp. BS19]GLJ00631.1 hypothetical protein Sbs19_44490 [Sphingobium sp. BS19]
MRLRSSQLGQGSSDLRAVTDGSFEADAFLPEQLAAVRKLQAETGESFEFCAVELGYDQSRGASPVHAMSDNPEPETSIDRLVVMVSDPDDAVAVSARELRSVIGTMRTRMGDPVRRIAVLSLQATTEASILAANLAAACAISGQKSLLIDANFVDPIQHRLFRRPFENGVCELLLGQTELPNITQFTAVRSLDLVPIGHDISRAAEMTERSALALMTEMASDSYDAVIVDAGPANQTGLSCAQGFDGALVVVQRDLTALKDTRKLMERLRSGGDFPVGIVVVN